LSAKDFLTAGGFLVRGRSGTAKESVFPLIISAGRLSIFNVAVEG